MQGEGETLEKPQQACAYRRLQGLQAHSSEGELLSPLDITNTIKLIAPGSAGAESPHSSPEPPTTDWAEMIPGTGLCLPQLLCRQAITPADIRRQTRKVRKARERLAVALRADRLAREAERVRSQESCEK